MSSDINPFRGSWDQAEGVSLDHPEELSFLEANRGTIIAVSAVAFLAIGSLVAGGLLLHFKVNMIVAWSLLGCGGGILLLDALIGRVILYVRHRKVEGTLQNISEVNKQQQGIYRIVSWNVGTRVDYSNMCFINNKMREGTAFLDAYHELLNGPPLLYLCRRTGGTHCALSAGFFAIR